jgi:hypothetical protein
MSFLIKRPRVSSSPEKGAPPAEPYATVEHEMAELLPLGVKLAFAPDWGYFIQNSANRERLSLFRHTAEEALVYYIEQGGEKVY